MQNQKQVLVGRYEIVEWLSEGGFGLTFKAKDLHQPNHPICVVKQIKPQTSMNEALSDLLNSRFYQEAEMLQKLGEHPQIPRLLAYFREQNDFYLVQEYIVGHTLKEEIKPGHPLHESSVIDILQQVLEVLIFIHEKKVIHRDIKPLNIIRREPDNKLVLIDFGAVKEVTSDENRQTTITIGTHAYMPEEQKLGRPKFCSDVYALGILCIEAIKGVKFEPFNPSDQLYKNEDGELTWEHNAKVSRGLATILNHMIRSRFDERCSANEALKAIKNLSTGYNDTTIASEKQDISSKLNNKISQPLNTAPKSFSISFQRPQKWLLISGFISLVIITVLIAKQIFEPQGLKINGLELQEHFEATDTPAQPSSIFPKPGSPETPKLYVRRYTFWGRKNQIITLEMSSNEIDPRLVLFAPNGKELQANDDISTADHNAKLTVTLPADGEYVVQAQSSQGELGSYRIRVKE